MAAAGPGRCSSRPAAARAPTCSTSCAARPNAGASEGRRIVVAAWTRGSRERLANLLREHGFKDPAQEDDWAAIRRRPAGSVSLVTLGVERGFVADQLALVGEQDLLGERISRPPRRRKRADQFIAEATEIAEGDLVVHQEYGIGRYDGLETLHGHRRAARLPAADLRRRREAVPAGREHRGAVALRQRRRRAWRSTSWAASPGSRARRG